LKDEHPSDPRWEALKNLGKKLDLDNK